MVQPETEPTFSSQEYTPAAETTRQGRRARVAEHALNAYSLLPEIDTSHDTIRHYLEERVVGQGQAIEAIVNALDRTGMRSTHDNRPVATLAFLGPTGVGKTELAKALSEVWSEYGPNLITVNCAMYSNGHEVSTLTGAPPSYIGREQKPVFSADTVEADGTVILFDEIEKGAVQLHNLLLHVTDTGELTLNNGETVSFREAIIIMTSNLGSREMSREANSTRAGFGAAGEETASKQVIEAAAKKGFSDFFTPEFVGRTEMVVFHPLNEAELHQVIDVKLGDLNREYIDGYGVAVKLSPATRAHLVKAALTEKVSGVRPLIKALDKHIATEFGRYIYSGRIPEGTEMYVYHRDELSPHAAPNHKKDFIFASRPDSSIRKKQSEVPPLNEQSFDANSTDVVDLSHLSSSD